MEPNMQTGSVQKLVDTEEDDFVVFPMCLAGKCPPDLIRQMELTKKLKQRNALKSVMTT
jgi:hypothetical protein